MAICGPRLLDGVSCGMSICGKSQGPAIPWGITIVAGDNWMTKEMNASQNFEMALEEGWKWVCTHFPFDGYIKPARKESYLLLARIAHNWLSLSSRILDFGAGPCDKTAIFSKIGFDVVAYDDLEDPWHKLDNNRQRILDFAHESGIRYYIQENGLSEFPFPKDRYDMIMLHHVLEHLHDSPKNLLNDLVGYLREGGVLYVTVPNAANLRKRLALLIGNTNYPAYGGYYWYPGSWRGHVREYVRDDLVQLASYLNLEILELRSYNHFLHAIPAASRPVFRLVTRLFHGFSDSWMLVAQKPVGWQPQRSIAQDQLAKVLGRAEYFDYGSVQTTVF